MIEDIYPVRIDPALSTPVLASISVGWFDPSGRNAVSQVDPQGNEISVVGKVKLTPAEWPPYPQTLIADFGDQIRLARADIVAGDLQTVRLDLEWVSRAQPTRDYTVFVHVLGSQGEILTQNDQQPLGGSYPTSAWEPGEVIGDSIVVSLPAELDAANGARIELGLYEATTGARLPVLDAFGQVTGDSVTLPIPGR